jgi:FKBP-type peptidyl-prolyl cis-trans isomerase FklB
MEEYGKRESVVELPSGLQYEIITEGDGAKPGPKSTVKCHYHGTTISGKVFDSSVKRGTPASFPLNRVIAGWTEALQLMPVGSKWRLSSLRIWLMEISRSAKKSDQTVRLFLKWNCWILNNPT